MADTGQATWRTHAKQAPWAKIVGRALAGGLAYVLASRAFGSEAGDATAGGVSAFLALLVVQAWLVLRHGPDAAGDERQEEKSPEDDYQPPLFGNG